MNNIQLIGRWTKENDLKYSPQGVAVLKNTLAVNRRFDREKADFIRVILFKQTAELAANYTGKGSQVAITGRLETGSYQKDDGSTVYTTDVIADQIIFLDKKDSSQSQQQNGQQRQGGQQDFSFSGGDNERFDPNSLPF